ncbi:MAG: hypothetical protein ABI833_13535, partial [Acidobacteriota bacterium]
MARALAEYRQSDVGTTRGGVVSAAGIVHATTITAVWLALRGDPPKRGRARAFFRGGDNPLAISLNDARGCWFDYPGGIGGGVLDLIQRVRGS